MTRIVAGLLMAFLALPAWAERAVVSSAKGANVYSASGAKARKTGLLARNTAVETLEARDGRVRVRFRGGEGWIAARTVRVLPAADVAQPPVELPAPTRKVEPANPVPPPAAVSAPPPVPIPVESPAPSQLAANPPNDTQGTDGGYLARALKEEPLAKVETGPSFLSVIGSLLVVLALVAGAVYLLKTLAGRRLMGGGAKGKGIQVLATRPLGPRQGLLLVEVGGLPLLLAQSEGMVNLITEIRDPEAVGRLNDLYGFRETPFEAELRTRLDLESGDDPRGRSAAPVVPSGHDLSAGPSPEDRLSALRRRRRPGEDT